MKIITGATVCLMLSTTALTQAAERKSGAVTAADFNYDTRLERCALRQEGDGVSVTAKLFVQFQPDQRLAPEDGLDLNVAATGSGAPTVTAHAINTKGTGATNGRATGQDCSVEPSPRGTIPAGARTPATQATCSLATEGNNLAWSFTVPLAAFGPESTAKNYVGHVTLIKRGDPAGNARIVAGCDAPSGAKVSYDLAVGKKS